MDLKNFDYDLPGKFVAKYPSPSREDSRLLHLSRESGSIEHRKITDLPRLLRPGDLLVLNDTKVRPWRLFGRRASGGRVEFLFLRQERGNDFTAMVSANRPLAEGEKIFLPGGREAALGPAGRERQVHISGGDQAETLRWLEEAGEMPIPPYLGRRAEPIDAERYQTIYARVPGAVAAPTAGLHLNRRILAELEKRGVGNAALTLHVGPGTFRPVEAKQVEDHTMDLEMYEIPEETIRRIDEVRQRGGRILAVGTTVVRALEDAARKARKIGRGSPLRKGAGEAHLFIFPGHEFLAVDMLLTNFHLPRSTLLMLVSAFAGMEQTRAAYRAAREEEYRFYSYGDAMLIA